jgi:hypothetical protein
MRANSDPCAWPELVYRFIEFYKWEPQHLGRGKSVREFQEGVRRKEVPLNFMFLLLLRWLPPDVTQKLLEQFALEGCSGTGHFRLAHPHFPSYIQPDVYLESERARVFIELKLNAKIDVEQVQKYLLLHSELEVQLSGKKPFLFVLGPKDFADTWTPSGEATNDIQSFLNRKIAETPLPKELAKRINDKVSARYEDIKQRILYGATTWSCIGERLATVCDLYKRVGNHDTEMRIISDFLADLEQRGLYAEPNHDRNPRCYFGGGMDGIQAIEKHLREDEIVKMEPVLAGTAFYGRAEREFANTMGEEKDANRKEEMQRRYEEVAQKVKNLSRAERERTLLDEIEKWKRESGSV